MPTYQLCLDAPLPELINRIARAAAEVAPELGFDHARDVADLILRARVRQTVNCGVDGVCEATGEQVFPSAPAKPGDSVRPCRLKAADATDLPWMFAATCADRLRVGGHDRPALEERLASVFRQVIAPVLRTSPACGASSVCRAEATDPFDYF